MKATDYAQKYNPLFSETVERRDVDAHLDLVANLFNEMHAEMFDIAEKRHAKSLDAIHALVREFNTKGNKINELCGNTLAKHWFAIAMNSIFEQAKIPCINVKSLR